MALVAAMAIHLALPAKLAAQEETGVREAATVESPLEDAHTAPAALQYSLMELIHFGGIIGYAIILLSFIALALVIDDALLLRRRVLMPRRDTEDLRAMLESGRQGEIANPGRGSSFVVAMIRSGLAESARGYDAIVKAMEDSAEELAGRLHRRIEYLNVVANVSPMLGLLGTVVGMVRCFNQISISAGGADPRLLASGIFQALMTTVMGLTVAIPALLAFSLFRNRVDGLMAEASATAEQLIAPLRPAAGKTASEPPVRNR